ncbi:MAG TPA: DUF433 domain-containing protein [Tepidisphaeraceae bacterium]|nr:DUF433 domain-containing protein [Tepidisphaeraceae bacterium]
MTQITPIKVDPEIMGGKPCFAGTRVPIKNLFDYLAHGRTLDEFASDFPSVARDDALAVLDLANVKLAESHTIPAA